MTRVQRVITDLAEYTTSELEALENEHPEWGRLEVIDGALHATGGSAVGDRHQLLVQRLHLLFAAVRPPSHIVRLDTWWRSVRGLVRPDLALYRPQDRPVNRRSFKVAPWATLEVLSDDAHHDLIRKDGVYADLGVVRRAYLEPWGRYPWWCRLDGVDHDGPTATWALDGWPALHLDRDALLAD
ncbi:MAG: Uma2 family endonuclease [Egibacteraceae bacterium]